MPYTVIMPVFARDILQGGPYTLGFLMAGVGIGALMGALFLAARKNILGLEGWIVSAVSIFGCGLIAFSLSRVVWLSFPLIVLTGFGMMMQTASSNTLLQTIADDDKRGRVISYYAMAHGGMTPFGSLLAGSLASQIGAPNTLILGGISCLVGALLFAKKLHSWRAMTRPIYARIGLISEETSRT
jgi:MFS family permease